MTSLARGVPRPLKRGLRRVVPKRYWRHFDPNWHRHTKWWSDWEQMGELQFDFMVSQGLRPAHYFLDVGCGALRGGIHFIRYLERGHYFGVDRRADRLDIGVKIELPRHGLVEKQPVIRQIGDFGFAKLGRTFDFALAQSVFTHLPLNKIIRCLMNIERALVPGGRFYATIYLTEEGKKNLDPIQQTTQIVSHFDKNPFHYDLDTLRWICEGTSLALEQVGDWESPRNQQMILFTKT
jgi:SAM-dependent methyltransferase